MQVLKVKNVYPQIKKNNQIPNITPLRFILALLVMLFHIPQFCENRGFPFYNDLPIFFKGAEAVYMFFSLSGFLIIGQLYKEKKQTNFINLKAFYYRRVLRIFPLYYLILLFGFIYYRFILPFFGFEFENNYNLLEGILLTVTFFANIFSSYSPGGIIEILWSIAIEEQFYLLIAPLFFLLPLRKIKYFLLLFTVTFFCLYFSESFHFLKEYRMAFFYFSFSGLCSILMNEKYLQKIISSCRYLIIGLWILYFTTFFFKDNLSPIVYELYSIVLFGGVILALSKKRFKILENKLLNYLGTISYGIYMFHPILMQLVGFIYMKVIVKQNFIYGIDVITFYLMIIIGTIFLSHFSYKYYESFFLKMKRKNSD